MNLLEIFFIISGIIILLTAFDIAKRQKFNALHFIVFLGIGGGLLGFTFFPNVLNNIGAIFGIPRGADLLVYMSIIFLIYFVLLLLRKVEGNKSELTCLIREIAIQNAPKIDLKSECLILMRAYNEGSVIKNTMKELVEAGYNDILVVNDGSTDNTLSEIESLKNKGITIVTHYKNRGGGAALETGFEYIRRYGKNKYIITFDADGQHYVEDVIKAQEYIDNHHKVDVFLGSRFLGKRTIGMPFIRRIILKIGILFTAFMSHVVLSDAHNGFRIFRRDAINKISLSIDGMGYASEMIDIISSERIPYKEIPVKIRYTEYSLSKGQKNGNAIKIVMKFVWNKFFK